MNPLHETTSVPVRSIGSPPVGPPEPEQWEVAERPFAEYVRMIIEGKWTVLLVLIAALVVSLAYLFVATPIYGATSLVQIEQKRRTIAGLDELSSALGQGDTPTEPEIEIIRSRTLVGAVVDQLQLINDARPRTFPIIGRAIARRYQGEGPAAAPPLLSSFAWGGERIQLERFEVPDHLLDEPLTLTALEGGRYVVEHEGSILTEGSVGKTAASATEPQPVVVVVSELVARPGTQFRLKKLRRDDVISALQEQLDVQEKGRKGSRVISIYLRGEDAVLVKDIVNMIAGGYLKQNVERMSEEAAKTLEFLESQLPTLKAKVDAAQDALNAYKVRSGTVDTTTETKGMVERMTQIEKEIADAEARRTDLRQQFTERHPNIVAIANRLALLRSEQAALAARMRAVPQTELNTARLARDLKESTELYVSLLNKAQELRVAKSGTIGDVRIIDRAYVATKPETPKKPTVLGFGVVLGLVLGAAIAIVRRSWVECAEDADDVEAATGVPVYVTIPHTDAQAKISRTETRSGNGPVPLLADEAPADVAVEAIRSLRTTLKFALVESRNNVVALTSSTPGAGKSFLATNLAQVLATSGTRVLLVDADMRRGRLHRTFGLQRRPGLSDLITGGATLEESVRQLPSGILSVLPTGRIPPNPAELLTSAKFESLLKHLSSQFDLVIVDTPPVLAVTDPMLVARFAGVNFLVLRARKDTHHEIGAAVKEFVVNRVKLHGAVLNGVTANSRRYGRGYVRYEYPSHSGE